MCANQFKLSTWKDVYKRMCRMKDIKYYFEILESLHKIDESFSDTFHESVLNHDEDGYIEFVQNNDPEYDVVGNKLVHREEEEEEGEEEEFDNAEEQISHFWDNKTSIQKFVSRKLKNLLFTKKGHKRKRSEK